MTNKTYDYAIIGAGAAGLQLAMAMATDTFFTERSILIIDKSTKEINDRTWSYWEMGHGLWDQLLSASWTKGNFVASDYRKNLDLGDYTYKTLRSIDFYDFCKKSIAELENIDWIQDEVLEVAPDDPVRIASTTDTYHAQHVFDSRIDPEYYTSQDNYVRILQHFKGWVVETDKQVFKPDKFTMMDFRTTLDKLTSFIYVLPLSATSGLVEFTLFTPQLIADEVYDEKIDEYLKEVLQTEYNIVEIEKGIIPMTDYPFQHANERQITKIGTAGSWVKPSSGYSFKNCERYASTIVKNLKIGLDISQGIADKRHRLYDTIFLDVLHNSNKLGQAIFTTMYRKNPAHRILKFLDEDTNLKEDLKIINSFQTNPFLKALFRKLKAQF